MANKRYGENDGEAGGKASLEGQVKGKMTEKASFKPFSMPKDGGGDQEEFDGGKGGVSMPKDPKSLPKAGGSTV